MTHPLEDENFALAANQCHDGYGDEWGNHRCRAIDRAVSECEFLAKRATDLVEVLKPFANFYERHFKSWQDHESHWTNFDGLTVGDLRRARAALATEPARGEATQQQPDTLKRCTHCGFIVDTKYKAEFPK